MFVDTLNQAAPPLVDRPAASTDVATGPIERRKDWQRRVRFECDMKGVPLPLEYADSIYATTIKPLIERAFALAILIGLSPVFMAIAIALKCSDRGPVFFVQPRTGYLGKPFNLIKFRTMVPGAHAMKASLRSLNVHGDDSPDFKIVDDPRVTKIGKFLRKTSLDELPNLINVLRNEMAIVGPRPTSFAVSTYKMRHYVRLAVKPGITGLWQVSGRANVGFDQRTEMDVAYIRSMSLANDLKLMLRTVGAVKRADGAH